MRRIICKLCNRMRGRERERERMYRNILCSNRDSAKENFIYNICHQFRKYAFKRKLTLLIGEGTYVFPRKKLFSKLNYSRYTQEI